MNTVYMILSGLAVIGFLLSFTRTITSKDTPLVMGFSFLFGYLS
jgi:hypothetical protein